MTYSQKVARAFEIVDYLLIPPALLGLFVYGATIVRALGTGTFISGLTMLGFIVFGFVLMIGYITHSRGLLDAKLVAPLWLATAVYNAIPLFWCLYALAVEYQKTTAERSGGTGLFLIMHGFAAAYAAAVVCSLRAYKYDKCRGF